MSLKDDNFFWGQLMHIICDLAAAPSRCFAGDSLKILSFVFSEIDNAGVTSRHPIRVRSIRF